jgi:formylglycine-generating enzyme required for sulfatase activity
VKLLTSGPSPQNPQPFQTDSIDLQIQASDQSSIRPALLKSPFTARQASDAQKAWARFLGEPKVKHEPNTGMELVLIPPGEFTMGSSAAERQRLFDFYPFAARNKSAFDNEQSRFARITQPFYLGAYEVTVAQFRKFTSVSGYVSTTERNGMGALGWNAELGKFENKPSRRYSWKFPGFEQGEDHPVVNVSWHDAVAFCEWLSNETGDTYRLPREAEWEYACRGGTITAFWNGNELEQVTRVANVKDESVRDRFMNPDGEYEKGRDGFVFTSPVGSYPSNSFGLYDTHGNVQEWCRDYYHEEFFRRAAEDDPENNQPCDRRTLRGGTFKYAAGDSRSASRRGGLENDGACYCQGFRVLSVIDA